MKRFDLPLKLDGLAVAPAQVWGNVRLVPLRRVDPILDLRLGVRDYSQEQVVAQVDVGKATYTAYIPHGLVVQWTSDHQAVVPTQTRLGAREARRPGVVVGLKRMVRRESANSLRMLPMHLAVEGFLALHFGGPDIAGDCWNRAALRDGLSPRTEFSVRGAGFPGLDEALRLFEVHDDQCGVLVFVADQLASAMVVPHPDDYRLLHPTLVQDFYSKLLYQFGWAYRDVGDFPVVVPAEGVTDLPTLRRALQAGRDDWARFATEMASGVFGRTVCAEHVRTAGRFQLTRFFTGFDDHKTTLDGEHLGEAMTDDEGRLVYLKTYRLDRGQVRRGHVLTQLAAHDWDPAVLARAQGHGQVARVLRDIEQAGLGFLLKPQWSSIS